MKDSSTWAKGKLSILRDYLDDYTTAMKTVDFNHTHLIYVDATSGDIGRRSQHTNTFGYTDNRYGEYWELHDRSPRVALATGAHTGHLFDTLIFVERDTHRRQELIALHSEYPHRNMVTINYDANTVLTKLCPILDSKEKAVVFIDPFRAQVEWSTIELLAATQKVDCWVLFPLEAISSILLPNEEPSNSLASRLDIIFGGRDYWVSAPRSLLQDVTHLSRPYSQEIANLYRSRLATVFAEVAPPANSILCNSGDVPMFEMFFAAGNKKDAELSVPIAERVLQQLTEQSD